MNKLNIYVLEPENNIDLCEYIKVKYNLVTKINDIRIINVVIVNKVYNISKGLEIIDYMLMNGIEIVCIKNTFSKEAYLANHLIKDGAIYV